MGARRRPIYDVLWAISVFRVDAIGFVQKNQISRIHISNVSVGGWAVLLYDFRFTLEMVFCSWPCYRNSDVSYESQGLIRGLLQLKADRRLTATQVREKLEIIIAGKPKVVNMDQFVPTMPCDAKKPKSKTSVKVGLASVKSV